MRCVGIAGPAGSGKDTVADHLVAKFGFVKYSFADELYSEVALAFGVAVSELLRRETKEIPSDALRLDRCADPDFRRLAGRLTGAPGDRPLSPRVVLQLWGTEYRRASDPDYWVKKAERFIDLAQAARPRVAGVVLPGVRFENEARAVRAAGELWHVRRGGGAGAYVPDNPGHASERGVAFRAGDRLLLNNSTLERLWAGVDRLVAGETVVNTAEE